jgi:hypothetical protein
MEPRVRYAARVLERFRTLPGTLPRTLRQDRNLALRLFDRGVPIQKIEDAFVLALARRTFRSTEEPIEPIRSLHYFLPVLQELELEPPLPEYLAYLRARLVQAGAWLDEVAPLHHVPSRRHIPQSEKSSSRRSGSA